MRIRVLGCGWYGAHLSCAMLESGHEVETHEVRDDIFLGASGSIPARLHAGFHYPRSKLTRDACRDHHAEFMNCYGDLTRGVPVNIYAVAQESLIDFGSFKQAMSNVQFIEIERLDEYGLRNIEGAVLTGERHVVCDKAREFFRKRLDGRIKFGVSPVVVDDPRWDLTLDCCFCANDEENIDRFEPCLTVLLDGQTDTAVTVVDGPFCSIYPWNECDGLSSLTSASLTPISKTCRTWLEAKAILDEQQFCDLNKRGDAMIDQMAHFWPAVRDMYKIADFKLSIRAMPRSASDARLVDVVRVGERALRVRAGKIDAVFHAEKIIKQMIRENKKFINRVAAG